MAIKAKKTNVIVDEMAKLTQHVIQQSSILSAKERTLKYLISIS